jgi:MFS family permease
MLDRGSMVGAPFAAVISDRYGRRKGMFAGAVVIIIGMVIVSSASTIAQFVVGRFVLGFGIAIMTVAAPGYAIEIAPPHWRGRCAGEMNLSKRRLSISTRDLSLFILHLS